MQGYSWTHRFRRLWSTLTNITLYFSETAGSPPPHMKTDRAHRTPQLCYEQSIDKRRETCHSCESVQSADPQQTTSDQTVLTSKPKAYVPREREREGRMRGRRWGRKRRQSVKHNLVTPICHRYTWTHTAADLLVQMVKEQNKTESFFTMMTSFSSDRLEKGFCLKIHCQPLWGPRSHSTYLNTCMHNRNV